MLLPSGDESVAVSFSGGEHMYLTDVHLQTVITQKQLVLIMEVL